MTSGTHPRKQKHSPCKKKLAAGLKVSFMKPVVFGEFLHKSTYVCAHTPAHTHTHFPSEGRRKEQRQWNIFEGASFLWGKAYCNEPRTTDWIEVNIILFIILKRRPEFHISELARPSGPSCMTGSPPSCF